MHGQLNSTLRENIRRLEAQSHLIPAARKKGLESAANEIMQLQNKRNLAKIIFVCSHNSRRSQLAEIWLRAAVRHFQIDGVTCYSGGTEVTAFNPRMVQAIKNAGFLLARESELENPVYLARLAQDDPEDVKMFSKKFSDAFNPKKDFIAIMVCAQADKECPFVPGAYARISLPFEDPKSADNTANEKKVYDEKVKEIGREMLYLAKSLKEIYET